MNVYIGTLADFSNISTLISMLIFILHIHNQFAKSARLIFSEGSPWSWSRIEDQLLLCPMPEEKKWKKLIQRVHGGIEIGCDN